MVRTSRPWLCLKFTDVEEEGCVVQYNWFDLFGCKKGGAMFYNVTSMSNNWQEPSTVMLIRKFLHWVSLITYVSQLLFLCLPFFASSFLCPDISLGLFCMYSNVYFCLSIPYTVSLYNYKLIDWRQGRQSILIQCSERCLFKLLRI